jgi:hypothetical protein
MYRPRVSSFGGGGGRGVSSEGADGGQLLFGQTQKIAGEAGLIAMPTAADQSATAKAAVDAYMSARNGTPAGADALGQQTKIPGDFPEIDVKGDGLKDLNSPVDIGRAVNELMSQMGDMINQMFSAPMSAIGSLIGFLFKLFTEIFEGLGQALADMANAAASAFEDALKKQAEAAANAAAATPGLQPLELFNQAASTQTVATSLKNSAST